MAAIYKIVDDFQDDAFTLIALHSSMEDYAMGYAINGVLGSRLRRPAGDYELSSQASFSYLEWWDGAHECQWTLFANHGRGTGEAPVADLFATEPAVSVRHLVPEKKEVDYFLKLDQEPDGEEDRIVKALNAIPKVLTAYAVDAEKLKSKNNLIF